MTEHEFKMGDEVVAWDNEGEKAVRCKFVNQFDPQGTHPFRVLLKDGGVEIFKYCVPYKAPTQRPMTHKEIFELMARESVVFRYVVKALNSWMVSHWDNSRDIEDFEYCPVAELVDPLTESPWRKLEVEDL